jgi:hypothetical protein
MKKIIKNKINLLINVQDLKNHKRNLSSVCLKYPLKKVTVLKKITNIKTTLFLKSIRNVPQH